MGGPEIAQRVDELVVDARDLGVMGTADAIGKMPRVLAAFHRLTKEAKRRRPRAALLVGYSEFNARLGPVLRSLGTRVVWYAAPQIWAWRGGRGPRLGRASDCMAVILPFEPSVWRQYGVAAEYVGHPSLEQTFASRQSARARLGLSPDELAVAVLPGSRSGEVRRLLDPMLATVERLRARRRDLQAHVLASAALPPIVRETLAVRAARCGVPVWDDAIGELLPAFDFAIAASGTVTLECALAGVPPLIVYRTDAASAFMARHRMTVHHVGLPNLVLGMRRFPELLQRDVRPERMAAALEQMLGNQPMLLAETRRVRAELGPNRSPSERVAELVA